MKKLILLKSNFNFEEAFKTISLSNSEIITFDYESHKLLKDKKINHTISENYLLKGDMENIRDESYNLTNWFKNEKISKLLTYEGINIGSLFQVEFQYLLLPFLKKFLEIKRVFELNKDKKFYCSTELFCMMNQFSKAIENIAENENNEKFLHDEIKFPLTNSFNIKFSKKNFLRLKNISDNKLSKLLKIEVKSHSNNKTVVFVEFDPIKYEKMFLLSKEFPIDCILFNRRRPSIWNLKSYSILKNSKFIIPNSAQLSNKTTKIKILEERTNFENNLEKILKLDELFKNYFVINNESFWSCIKQNFIKLCKKRIADAIEEIEVSKEFLKKHNCSNIVVWSENGFNEQIMISLAKKNKIPIVLLQHGVYVDDMKVRDFNIFSGLLPIKSDKFVTWGNVMSEYTKKCDITVEKITIVGSTAHDKFSSNNRHDEMKNRILLAPTGPRKYYVNGLMIENIENYEKIIEKICNVVIKSGNELVVKKHPQIHEHDITKLVKNIDSSIKIVNKGDTMNLIQSSDIVIQVGISTIILEAQMLRKPTISIETSYDVALPQLIRDSTCIRTNVDNLEKELYRISHNEDYKQKILNKGIEGVNDNISNLGKGSELFLKYLQNV